MGDAKMRIKTDDMRAIADDLPEDGRRTAMMLREAANELDERRRLDCVLDDTAGCIGKITRADLIAYLLSRGWRHDTDYQRMSGWVLDDEQMWVYESKVVDEGKIRQLAACEHRSFPRTLADVLDIAERNAAK